MCRRASSRPPSARGPFAQGHDPAIRLFNYIVTGEAPECGRLLTELPGHPGQHRPVLDAAGTVGSGAYLFHRGSVVAAAMLSPPSPSQAGACWRGTPVWVRAVPLYPLRIVRGNPRDISRTMCSSGREWNPGNESNWRGNSAVESVSKRYGGVHALEQVNLTCATARCTLVGENGAGKSTLIKVLGGIIPRNGGRVLFEGNRSRLSASHRSTPCGDCHYPTRNCR